jgi:O-antigen/teichoic acid export membrane protein
MSAITEKNSRTIAKFYTDVFNFYQSILYVAAAAMLLFIRQLLDIMTVGEGFNEAYRHSPMLILAVVLTCFCTFMGSVYIASKKSVRSMLTVMSGAAANLILNFLFIPMMGINGAALSTLISYIIVFTVRVIDTRSLVYMDLHLVKMSANFIILGLMGAVVMLVESTNFYYVSLAVLFLIVVVLNYRAGITALQFVIRKKKHD